MIPRLPSFREVMETMSPSVQNQLFEVSAEGTVKCHGYSVDEVVMLLEAYRTHMTEFGRNMQSLANGSDAARWNPIGPEDV